MAIHDRTSPGTPPELAPKPAPARSGPAAGVAVALSILSAVACRPSDPHAAVKQADRLVAQYHPGPIEPRYRLGDRLSFGSLGNAGGYLREGWSVPENGYVWTLGHRAVVELPVETPATGGSKLDLRARPLLFEKAVTRQRVDVSVNSVAIGTWTLSQGDYSSTTLDVPARAVAGRKELEIAFDLPDAAAPVDIGYNPDTRVLGVAFAELALHE